MTVTRQTATSVRENSRNAPLEDDLQCKLHLSWSIRGRANESKRIAGQGRIWCAPNHPIEHVKHFPAEIHANGFSKLKGAGNRKVLAHNPGSSRFRVQSGSTAEPITQDYSFEVAGRN